MQLCPLMAGLRPQTAFSRDQLQPGFNPQEGQEGPSQRSRLPQRREPQTPDIGRMTYRH